MKRKFVCGTVALCLALSVAGCGKSSEEQQAANYYQNELGLDKDEAEELAHEIYGQDEEEPSVTEAPEEIVVEPLPEIVNSEWYDRKVQIYDMVFTRDEYLTEEAIRKIVEGSAYNVELIEKFEANGDMALDKIMLDGKDGKAVFLSKRSRSGYVSAGLADEDGDYYTFENTQIHLENNWYNKGVMELEALDFKTRDDVLAYLAENGFVKVEESQAPYDAASYAYNEGLHYIKMDGAGVEFADVPHYYSKGAQIRFFRAHKLDESDQEMKFDYRNYTGCRLNLFERVYVNFNTDGTISWTDIQTEPCLIMGEIIK